MKFLRSPYFSPSLTALVCLAGFAFWAFFLPDTVIQYTRETGPFERLTEWAYLGAIVLLFLLGLSVLKRKTLAALLLVLAYMAAHAANLHKTPLSTGMLKMKFWLLGTVSATVLAIAILLPIACAVLYLFAFCTRSALAGMRERMPHAISIFTVLALAVFTNILHHSWPALVKTFGQASSQSLWALQAALEAPLTCLIPFLFIVALFQYRHHIRQRGRAFFSRY